MSFDKTLSEYNAIVKACEDIFIKKTKDYGTSWRVMRPKSLTDQMFIKAKRIRTIEEAGSQQIEDSIASEFIGLVNYGYMALIQLDAEENMPLELGIEEAVERYERVVSNVRNLMIAKNTDYGEAWRDMRISSFTDLIMTKLHRIKQIEDNQGATIISEGIDANYKDIINYSIFALIQMNFTK
ncbi:MAG: DUF1599 domain-containing protein [Chitinophagales bacterium]|nr:DUF1599 domain-containing protein [Chitinophagales bacterium]MCZ2394002.1 DUF1599 domain-containing protein [Chitinophagales bacterium]